MAKRTKGRFTASVRESLINLVDEQAVRLDLTRSEAVEQAMELWLKVHSEKEEDAYFQAAAAEMNADAADWNALTSKSAVQQKE
jgi:hypothetical protein